MARRYSQEELDAVKQGVDLVALIQSRGIKLDKHGSKDLKGLCPFHNDTNPSLIVSPHKNLWNCPACGKGGDVIKFVQEHDGVSFRHAVELLKDGQVLGGGSAVVKKTSVPRLEAPVELNGDDHQQLRRIIDYYHKRFLDTPQAQAYLRSRGVYSPEAIKTFKLGYADRTLGLRLPQKNRKEGKALRRQLQKIGLYRETGHEHFNGCLIIPVIDRNGVITEVYGRRLIDTSDPHYTNHLYLPGPHRGVWNPAAFAAKELILCESLIDALTFWSCGLRNVTASYGTGGFTSDHLAAMLDGGVETVYIAYDRDEAGDTAAGKLAEKLGAEGLRSYRVQFPAEMDANDYALTLEAKREPVRPALEHLLRSATFLDVVGAAPPRPACLEPAGTATAAEPPEPEPSADSADEPEQEPAAEPAAQCAAAPGPAEPPAAPARPGPTVPCEVNGEDIDFALGERAYRVRGLARNTSFDIMKVNLRVTTADGFFVDTLDLYNARQRKAFLHAAAEECRVSFDVVKRDTGRILLKLEELQEQNLAEALESTKTAEVVELSDQEKAEAFELLRTPQLLERIAGDFELAGLVGERANALVAYLAAASRRTDDPLAVIIQSSSSAGKSSLLDAVLSFMPEEATIRYTAMTGQSLFYMGETELAHKILAISEEEGAEQAGYALKILQSEKCLKIASTGKDAKTGRHVAHEYVVEGPSAIFMTSTNPDIEEELQNRCIVLTVNEERRQTDRIHGLQRRACMLDGLLRSEDRKRVLRTHRNAQRLLRPLHVINPYADQLTFANSRLRTRRDHMKYLNLINAVALLHQYQRDVHSVEHNGRKLEYIEVSRADIEAANGLAGAVLGTSLDDLPPQTRKLLGELSSLVADLEQRRKAAELCEARQVELAELRLSRRHIREHTGWSDTQLRVHLQRLVDLEYLDYHRAGAGGRFEYELLYRGEGLDGERFLLNLIDPEKLVPPEPVEGHDPHAYNGEVAGQNGEVAGANGEVAGRSRPGCGQVAGSAADTQPPETTPDNPASAPEVAASAEITSLDAEDDADRTYPQANDQQPESLAS